MARQLLVTPMRLVSAAAQLRKPPQRTLPWDPASVAAEPAQMGVKRTRRCLTPPLCSCCLLQPHAHLLVVKPAPVHSVHLQAHPHPNLPT